VLSSTSNTVSLSGILTITRKTSMRRAFEITSGIANRTGYTFAALSVRVEGRSLLRRTLNRMILIRSRFAQSKRLTVYPPNFDEVDSFGFSQPEMEMYRSAATGGNLP